MTVKRKKNVQVLASLETLADFGNTSIEVGWVQAGQRHADTKLTVPQLAAVQEYGAVAGHGAVIPPRPMLRTTVRKRGKQWIAQAEALSKQVLKGKKINAEEIFGALVADDVKAMINDSKNWIPNATATVRRKGKNTPLIDTGAMRDAVDYRVHKGKIK